MMWLFAILVVLAMGGVAMVASGRGGSMPEAYDDRPDVAIEVVWTSGGIDRLEVYRKLRVQEVWFYERGTLRFFTLPDERYAPLERSELLPGVDPELLVRCMAAPSQSEAIHTLRDALRAQRTGAESA